MATYKYRPLSGNYQGSVNNAYADYLKISNGMLELSIDIATLFGDIAALQSINLGILNPSNFLPNSIPGSIIIPGSLPGAAITPGSITGSDIISNSINGITDSNISPNANISASKINVGQISHTQLANIGNNTHPQIDSDLAQLFNDVGDIPGSGFTRSLSTLVANNTSSINIVSTNLTNLSSFINEQPLTTNSQTISPAINELANGLASVGASGFGISGPNVAVQNSLATWGTNNKTLESSSADFDNNNNLYIPGNLYFYNSGNMTIGNSGAGIGTLYLNGQIKINDNGSLQLSPSSNFNIEIPSPNTPAYPGYVTITTPSGNFIFAPGYFEVEEDQILYTTELGTAENPVTNAYISNLYVPSGSALAGIYQFPTNTVGPYISFPETSGVVELITPSGTSGTGGLMLSDQTYSYLQLAPADNNSPNGEISSSGNLYIYGTHGLVIETLPAYNGDLGQSITIESDNIGIQANDGSINIVAAGNIAMLSTAPFIQLGNFACVEITQGVLISSYINNSYINVNDTNIEIGASGLVISGVGDGMIMANGTNAAQIIKMNYTAIGSPNTSNDQTEGYSTGSMWIDTVGISGYLCMSPVTSAAIWKAITS